MTAPHPSAPGAGPPLVFLVDDDVLLRELYGRWLSSAGMAVREFHDGVACLRGLTEAQPDAIGLDLNLPGLDGLDTLARIKVHHPALPVIVMTAHAGADMAVAAMKGGAYDYLVKPIEQPKLVAEMQNAVERSRLAFRVAHLEREAEGRGYPGIIGLAPAMLGLFRRLDRLAASDITVLIEGESGVGKELVARAIHRQSGRGKGAFVALNCAAIPESLEESELFGHEKGAFTGAASRHLGAFERADGGTLFLDEISELSANLQAKLLRVLQERSFYRVGGTAEVQSDFRLIAATNRQLLTDVRAGRFREDLYFRIAVMEIEVPPLRERRSDIPLLAQHFLGQGAEGLTRTAPSLGQEARELMLRYAWPGNVRELKGAMERVLVECDGTDVEVAHLPPRVRSGADVPRAAARADSLTAAIGGSAGVASPHAAGGMTLEDLERAAITAAMTRHDGNLTEVVRELGIGRTTLYRKLKKFGLR